MVNKNSIKRYILPLVVSILAVVLILYNIMAQETASKLADTKGLEASLSKADIRIVDVRDKITDYWESHIPGAVYLNIESIRWSDQGVPGKLISPEGLAILLGNMGIDNNTLVVAYSTDSDFKPTYLLWALDYIGHKNFMVLDGGFKKWKAEGRPVTQDYPKIAPKKYNLPKNLNNGIRATLEQVKENVKSGKALLLDVRSVDLYTGEKGVWKRKGHIKGAISRFWGEDIEESGVWKSKEELKKAYEALGATPDKNIIASCGQGLMSAHTYFTLKYILGYQNVSNYDGGFNEWSNIDDLPIETGMTTVSANTNDEMQNLIADRCIGCHKVDKVYKEKANKAQWEKIINIMISYGAKLNENEKKAMIEYLSSR